jgi:hypothetical protein
VRRVLEVTGLLDAFIVPDDTTTKTTASAHAVGAASLPVSAETPALTLVAG